MILLEKICVMNMDNAVRGARNPMSSWEKSDSYVDGKGSFVLGENDRNLTRRLCRAGSDHRKFIRQIFVSVDITAPLYWWKEFDTYKVATVANSTSTMHRLHAKPLTLEDFSTDRMSPQTLERFGEVVDFLESLRLKYIETKEKAVWDELIQFLPSSYQQLRTVTLNYETLINIYYARRGHKLKEWHTFCGMIETLPYAEDFLLVREDGQDKQKR